MSATVFQGSAAYSRTGLRSGRPVVTIGNFDGVHLGHQTLLRRVIARAAELGGPSCVFTFHPPPRDVLRPDNPVPRIQSLEDKLDALQAVGIEQIVVEPFDLALAGQEPRWFADEILVRRLNVGALVLGYDFRFGKRRAGNAAMLRKWLDVPVEEVEACQVDGEIVSSSRIRELVREGAVEEARRLLTRPHRARGVVQAGDQRGRELGFPTANVRPETPLLPAPGVYAVRAHLEGGAVVPAVANLGRRPTFGGDGGTVLEVHLLDFTGDLYDQKLGVDFIARVRDEVRFAGVQELVSQIKADVATARQILGAETSG